MNSEPSGQTSSDLQRQAAAQIARRKVLAAYLEAAQKKAAENGAGHTEEHMKDVPVSPKISSESWKNYHSAWQSYYQKYYSEYYSNAAREYVAKEQMKAMRKKAEEEEIILDSAFLRTRKNSSDAPEFVLGTANAHNQLYNDPRDDNLRYKIRKKATDSARKARRRRKFIPIIAGVTVMLTILFLQYNRLIFAPIMAYVSPGNAPDTEIEALDPTITQTISADPRLIIPKLNIDVPIRFGITLDEVMSAMNNGVAHYRIAGANAYPGEVGNFIITGHSAGDVYSSNPYKYIFSGLERLEDGDLIYVNYNSKRYTYKVYKKEVVEPTDVGALVISTDKPLITLVTCTPLGTSRYRLLVTGEQISPNPNDAPTQQPDVNTNTGEIAVDDGSVELPSNEPSFFERIWNFLTGQ